MNSGMSYISTKGGNVANCSDFGNMYLPSYGTFEAAISAFNGTNSSIINPPLAVNELNGDIIDFAANVESSPQAVGQTNQEEGGVVETFAIEFTKGGNSSAYSDWNLKSGTIKFTLSPSSDLLLQSTTPFVVNDANPRVVNIQAYWRGVTSTNGQFITTTINPVGPYMVYQEKTGVGAPYTLPSYSNSFATFRSIQGDCPGSDETKVGPGHANELEWLDDAKLQFCADTSSSLTQPYTGIAESAFLFPSFWTTWEVQIVDIDSIIDSDYYQFDQDELALQVVFQYVASPIDSTSGSPNSCAMNCHVQLTPGAISPSPLPGSQWCDKTDCNQCLADQIFDEMKLINEDFSFCLCNVWTGATETCHVEVETTISPRATDAIALAKALPSFQTLRSSSFIITAASVSAFLMLLTSVARRARVHLRRRVQYTSIPEIPVAVEEV